MLLYSERAGVDCDAKDLDIGHESRPQATKREREQLCYDLKRISITICRSAQ